MFVQMVVLGKFLLHKRDQPILQRALHDRLCSHKIFAQPGFQFTVRLGGRRLVSGGDGRSFDAGHTRARFLAGIGFRKLGSAMPHRRDPPEKQSQRDDGSDLFPIGKGPANYFRGGVRRRIDLFDGHESGNKSLVEFAGRLVAENFA